MFAFLHVGNQDTTFRTCPSVWNVGHTADCLALAICENLKVACRACAVGVSAGFCVAAFPLLTAVPAELDGVSSTLGASVADRSVFAVPPFAVISLTVRSTRTTLADVVLGLTDVVLIDLLLYHGQFDGGHRCREKITHPVEVPLVITSRTIKLIAALLEC